MNTSLTVNQNWILLFFGKVELMTALLYWIASRFTGVPNKVTTEVVDILCSSLFSPIYQNFTRWSLCCRLLLSRSGLRRWSMTRMMLTLRTKLIRWGTLRASVRHYKAHCLATRFESGRAVTLFHDSSTQCRNMKNAYLMLWVTIYDLYCHAVQNRCILSSAHLLLTIRPF